MEIAFAGIGKMGLPMARHLCSAGHNVTVFDPSAVAMNRAASAELAVATSLADACSSADCIVSSLPDDHALIYFAQQLSAMARPARVWIDTSTVSVEASRTAASLASARGIDHLRATVSGNAAMAESAQLTIMASGPQALFDSLSPLLACWGPRCFYVGDADQARLMKLVVNLMIGQTTAALAEALTLGEKGGISWETLWSVISESAVASPIVKAKREQLQVRDFSPTFTVRQMEKDLGLILEAGRQLGVSLPLTVLAAAQQALAAESGFGDEDYAAVIKVAERAGGVGSKSEL